MVTSLILKILILFGLLIAIAIYIVEYLYPDKKKKEVIDSHHDPYSTCSLCGRLKSEVGSMVEGQDGTLCSDCLIDSALLLDDASKNNHEEVRFIHRLLIATLSRSCGPEDCDENIRKYILEVETANPEKRSKILNIAYSLANTSLIIDILEQAPRGSWTLEDTIFWMYANCNKGDYSNALDHPEVKRENCTDAEFRIFTLNRITASIEMRPESEEIVQYLSDLGSIRITTAMMATHIRRMKYLYFQMC